MKVNKLRTLDDICNAPAGTFKKFIKDKHAKLDRYNQWKKEAITLRKQGKEVPEFPENIELWELA